jgi:hypothetical protein
MKDSDKYNEAVARAYQSFERHQDQHRFNMALEAASNELHAKSSILKSPKTDSDSNNSLDEGSESDYEPKNHQTGSRKRAPTAVGAGNPPSKKVKRLAKAARRPAPIVQDKTRLNQRMPVEFFKPLTSLATASCEFKDMKFFPQSFLSEAFSLDIEASGLARPHAIPKQLVETEGLVALFDAEVHPYLPEKIGSHGLIVSSANNNIAKASVPLFVGEMRLKERARAAGQKNKFYTKIFEWWYAGDYEIAHSEPMTRSNNVKKEFMVDWSTRVAKLHNQDLRTETAIKHNKLDKSRLIKAEDVFTTNMYMVSKLGYQIWVANNVPRTGSLLRDHTLFIDLFSRSLMKISISDLSKLMKASRSPSHQSE